MKTEAGSSGYIDGRRTDGGRTESHNDELCVFRHSFPAAAAAAEATTKQQLSADPWREEEEEREEEAKKKFPPPSYWQSARISREEEEQSFSNGWRERDDEPLFD